MPTQQEVEFHASDYVVFHISQRANSWQPVNSTCSGHMPICLQVYQLTAHTTCVVTQQQLPPSPRGFSSFALIEMGRFFHIRAQRLRQTFLLNQFFRFCVVTQRQVLRQAIFILAEIRCFENQNLLHQKP